MSTMIVCPGCGTEVDYREIEPDNGKCSICGKVLLAEVMKKRQEAKRSGSDKLEGGKKSDLNSYQMGKKLQQLGDDDLFGDLEPFNLGDKSDEVDDKLLPGSSTKVRKLSSDEGKALDNLEDIELDEDEKFENPMAKSSLMKKLKEDQDLFGSLDG